ncbi:MAG: hypothetical protein ACREXU_07095 [Gammaproteobacteria bacterium]
MLFRQYRHTLNAYGATMARVRQGGRYAAAVADDDRVRLECAEKALAAVGEATHTFQTPYITFLLLGTYIGVIIASPGLTGHPPFSRLSADKLQ